MAKTEPITIRLTETELAIIDACAVVRKCTRREAIMHYIHLGMSEDGGTSPAATRADIDVLKADISAMKAEQQATAVALFEAIKNQPIAIQETAPALPPAEPGRKMTRVDHLKAFLTGRD